jgi:hypothetical protein
MSRLVIPIPMAVTEPVVVVDSIVCVLIIGSGDAPGVLLDVVIWRWERRGVHVRLWIERRKVVIGSGYFMVLIPCQSHTGKFLSDG